MVDSRGGTESRFNQVIRSFARQNLKNFVGQAELQPKSSQCQLGKFINVGYKRMERVSCF